MRYVRELIHLSSMIIHLWYFSFHLCYVIWSKLRLCWSFTESWGTPPWSFWQLGRSTLIYMTVQMPSLMTDQSLYTPHSLNQGNYLTIGASACIWWFFTLLRHLLLPRSTPTHPCAHPHLYFPHLCSIILLNFSHYHLFPFWMVWDLIGPPRGVLRSNPSLTHVCIQISSKR